MKTTYNGIEPRWMYELKKRCAGHMGISICSFSIINGRWVADVEKKEIRHNLQRLDNGPEKNRYLTESKISKVVEVSVQSLNKKLLNYRGI